MTFWAKVDKSGNCWLWTGNTRNGYGVYWNSNRRHAAHRWSYELENGPIPEGLVIDHLCRVTICVNPAHLRAVPQRVNLMSGRTIVAAEAERTVCRRGHPLEGDNLWRTPEGWRQCRQCVQDRMARSVASRRERAIARSGSQDG